MARQPSLDSAEVARRVVFQLVHQGYVPGDRLASERSLAQQLGVGRSVVGEALRSLSLLGIVDLRRGDAAYLSRSTEESIPKATELGLLLGPRRVRDLSVVDTHLETVMAGLAAERRTDQALAAMDANQADLINVLDDSKPLMATHREFHHQVWTAASNRVLAQALASICALLDAPLSRVMEAELSHRWIAKDHALVLEAIRYRDAEHARAAMTSHLIAVSDRLRSAITPTTDAAGSP